MKSNRGITIVALVITVIVLIIIAGVSFIGTEHGKEEAIENRLLAELEMVQHALLERYTKSKITHEELPGIAITEAEINNIIQEINQEIDEDIELKGIKTDYKMLSSEDLSSLGISNKQETYDTYIVNYKTGEVINYTEKQTNSGKVLYVYAVE